MSRWPPSRLREKKLVDPDSKNMFFGLLSVQKACGNHLETIFEKIEKVFFSIFWHFFFDISLINVYRVFPYFRSYFSRVGEPKFEGVVLQVGTQDRYGIGNAFKQTPWGIWVRILSGNGQLEVVEKTLQTVSTFFAFLLPASTSSAGMDHIYECSIGTVDPSGAENIGKPESFAPLASRTEDYIICQYHKVWTCCRLLHLQPRNGPLWWFWRHLDIKKTKTYVWKILFLYFPEFGSTDDSDVGDGAPDCDPGIRKGSREIKVMWNDSETVKTQK